MKETLAKALTRNRLAATSVFATISWIVIILFTMGNFQNTHSVDPLAMIDALYPYFWVLLIFLAALFSLTLYLDYNDKWLHLLLVNELALILFVTPFFISGYSWSPDSLWHGGEAVYMPQILQGKTIAFSTYPQSYPISYLLSYSWMQISGLNVFTYTLYVYPTVASIAIASLGYVFVEKLLNPKIAFLSMILALPAYHFIEPHTSPFSFGTILVLAAFVMLAMEGKEALSLLFLFVVVDVVAHPVSPLTLGIFFIAVILVKEFFTRYYWKVNLQSIRGIFGRTSYQVLLFLGVVWFAWTTFWAFNIYKSVGYTIYKFLTLGFLTQLGVASEFTGGGGFIYQDIYLLNQSVYVVFVVFALAFIFLNLRQLLVSRKADYTTLLGVLFVLSALAYAAYSYVLFLASGVHFLLGRGLLFFAFAGGICAAMVLRSLSEKRKLVARIGGLITVSTVVFLLVSFPIISYNKEAYNTYTPSTAGGMGFIGNYLNVSKFTMSIGSDQQLTAYINLTMGFNLLKYEPELNASVKPDFVVLRVTSFFIMAMRYDLSFENNTFTRLRDALEQEINYGKIYSSGTFDVYYYAPNP